MLPNGDGGLRRREYQDSNAVGRFTGKRADSPPRMRQWAAAAGWRLVARPSWREDFPRRIRAP